MDMLRHSSDSWNDALASPSPPEGEQSWCAVVAVGVLLEGWPGWMSPGVEVALGTVVVVAAVVAGWWGYSRYRHEEKADSRDGDATDSEHSEPTEPESMEPPAPAGAESGLHRVAASATEPGMEKAVFGGGEEMPSRRCPECERAFPGVFDVCPFDSTPLRDREASVDDGGTRRLPRRRCPECSRRYELGATHCYRDGHQLQRDTDQACSGAPTFRVCRSCGFETLDALEECPEDGEPLVCLDPMQRRRVKPAFPYNRCRQCGHVASPDQTRCPTDGSLLLPELSVQLSGLPPTGYGPRRRVCPDCGTAFGPHCEHCSRDGTKLIELN